MGGGGGGAWETRLRFVTMGLYTHGYQGVEAGVAKTICTKQFNGLGVSAVFDLCVLGTVHEGPRAPEASWEVCRLKSKQNPD